jgi:hypothetical protein
MSHRERVTYDKLGTPQKTYKSDSWDDSKTVNDLSGAQRSPDALSPAYSEADSVEDQVYYTLGPSGMIDTFMERMEQIKWTDGSKLDGPTDDSISGKMFCPNHGSGSMMWQGGIWLPVMPAPPGLIPPLPGTPKAPEKPKANNPHTEINAPPVRLNPQPMPKGPYPDPDPHFNPKPYYGPGSDRMSADFMGSSAYNNPNFGLPSDGGGSFIGLGRFDSACNIPNDMQPSTPSGGLFGPDFGIGIWGFPGYRTPGGEGIFLPVARRSGPSIPHAIDTSGLPSGRPGLSWPTGFETAIMSGSEYYAKACRWADSKWSEHYKKYGRSPVVWVDIAYCDQHSGPQDEATKNRDGSPIDPNKSPHPIIPGHVYVGNGMYSMKQEDEIYKRHQEDVKSGKNLKRASRGQYEALDEMADYDKLAIDTLQDLTVNVAIEIGSLGLGSAVEVLGIGLKSLGRVARSLPLISEAGTGLVEFVSGMWVLNGIMKFGGRLGNYYHRFKIARWTVKLERWGWRVKSFYRGGELLIKCEKGLTNRFPDIIAWKDGKILMIQFGRGYKRGLRKGLPVKRELEAISDLCSEFSDRGEDYVIKFISID